MTPRRSPTVFWCSRCKERHAGDCPAGCPVDPGVSVTLDADVYLLNGQTSCRYDPKLHGDLRKMLSEGWCVYDPMSPPGDDCRATIQTHLGPPCRHGYSWQCPRVPRPKRTP